jgi:hypothetical protein
MGKRCKVDRFADHAFTDQRDVVWGVVSWWLEKV